VAASVVFVACITLTGGFGRIDSQLWVYTTWAVAHGDFNCAYPSVTMPHQPLIAPVYPLFAGAVTAVAGIGHAVPFPSHAAMGAHCNGADVAIKHWAARAGAAGPTRAISFSGWLVLLVGMVAWLRSAGRGRRRWEPATLLFVAALPLVWSCDGLYMHPQDLFALGLGLAAMACARRQWWGAAGALIALAVLTHQYALLIAAPLLVLAPSGRRGRYVGAAAAMAVCLVAPLYVVSDGTILRAITIGSGATASFGGTVMWEVSHRGALSVLISRVLPIVLALAVSWWVVRRLGPRLSASPTVMLSLVAVSLSLRLVFEQNLYEYYFMALAVTLVLLDVTRGRIRTSVLVWLATTLMTFSLDDYFLRVASGLHLQNVLPPLVLIVTLSAAAIGIVRGRTWRRWTVLLWSCLVVCALVTGTGLWLPTWFVQVIFVGTGALLAATPLLELRPEAARREEVSLPSTSSG
jgi:hypothetical protein